MVQAHAVPHDRLVERFLSAVSTYEMDDRADNLPRYLANLHAVERDLLGVPESNIELPPWVGHA